MNTGDLKEEQLIQALRKGDQQSLNYFFKMHYRAICYFVNKMICNDAESEDIAATAFVKLWERREGFDSGQKIKAFLYITCRNASLNYLTQLKRRSLIQQEYLHYLEVIDVEVLNSVVESEFLNTLHQEVALLPDQCRKVFSLLYFEGKKTDEIAEILNLSVKTVRNYKARAIEILRNSFLKRSITDALSLAIFIFLNKK